MTRAQRYVAATAVAFGLLTAIPTMAAQATVDEKTQLTFSDSVMVPGKTLSPGSYTFQVVNSDATQQLVQVLDDQGRVLTTTVTVPLKRNTTEIKGDTVLRFNPTTGSASAPVALKGWFYPGTTYGHEFVYPDEEARQIAERTKSIVLSTDVTGEDAKMGRIYTYDASGRRAPWTSQAHVKTAPGRTASKATTPMIQADTRGMRVRVGQLEERPTLYIGKTVRVDAEVDEVLGPRVFKIDEPTWADLDAEMLVYVPTDLAALVKEDDRVTITGTVKPFARAEIERDFDWLDPMPELQASFSMKPVLVASRIVGGDNDTALTISVARAAGPEAPVGTSGTAGAAAPISSLDTLTSGGNDLVGRHVNLDGVTVAGHAGRNAFWVKAANGQSVYVLPARSGTEARPAAGDRVSVTGVVLEMPRSMKDQFKSMANFNDDVYVFASAVSR